MGDKSLTGDQVQLLTEVMARTTPSLKPHEWNDVATKLGISNGKAAKERFRYLMNSLTGSPSKTSKAKTEPATPRKSIATSGTPSKKRKSASEENTPSAKKAKSKPTKGEVNEEGEEETLTPIGMQGHSTMHRKQGVEQHPSDEEFSFFDHALYQQDLI